MKVATKLLNITLAMTCLSASYWAQAATLKTGQSFSVRAGDRISTIFTSNPAVSDYKVISDFAYVVYAKSPGTSEITSFDHWGTIIKKHKITVVYDLERTNELLKNRYPHLKLSLTTSGDKVLVSGEVSSNSEKDAVLSFIYSVLNKSELDKETEEKNLSDSGTKYLNDYTYSGIIDDLKVKGISQINVKMTIAEVSSNLIERLGFNIGSATNGKNNVHGTFTSFIESITDADVSAILTAIKQESGAAILAEPNLTVVSGESADFLVGGEQPVQTVGDQGQPQVEYREYGIKLNLAAKHLSNGNIRVTLNPEVSSIEKNGDSSSFPSFTKRNARTTVELKNGQSFALAGLINHELGDKNNSIPYVGEIPIIGSLFSNISTVEDKKELVIFANVNLVKPSNGKIESIFKKYKNKSTIEKLLAVEPVRSLSGDSVNNKEKNIDLLLEP